MAPAFNEGDWVWSTLHRVRGKVVDVDELWGHVRYRVWLPTLDTVLLHQAQELLETAPSLADGQQSVPTALRFAAVAGRVSALLQDEKLLAPLDAAIIPLPHQIRALRRVVGAPKVRFLLADEVGLGKTIEAGLILRELKLRGLVRRILIIAPKGLIPQWLVEMKDRFGEEFRHLDPADFEAYRQISPSEDNVWKLCDRVICSMDSVKPLDSRKGWSAQQVEAYNQERVLGLASAGWDLIIIDEAHRVAGSGDSVARHVLARTLGEAAPSLLMLSATPHQGKTEAFHRLVWLLDRDSFPDASTVSRDRVAPFVIRTEKRQAIDNEGRPLFKPRLTHLAAIPWGSHADQRALYDAVTAYVRVGYNQALKEKKPHVGFLMILMQRLVSSSTRAIITTLERRLERLTDQEIATDSAPGITEESWSELDAQQQLEILLGQRLNALKNERKEVEGILEMARQVIGRGPDAKAEALLDWIYRLQTEEGEPNLKVLIFTEFVPTQRMLAEHLGGRGFSVVCLNGSMSMDERKSVQKKFSEDVRIMISTDAGGEGLNLQFCHVIINFDLGWRPMAIEQRIGRLDRIGQKKIVKAINFLLKDSVEFRVQEVLEKKLRVIFEEFGIDKTTDVLDSVEGNRMFDRLFVDALLHPETLARDAARVAETILEQAQQHKKDGALITEEPAATSEFDAVSTQPVGDLLELLVKCHADLAGGEFNRNGSSASLRWPGEATVIPVIFPGGGIERNGELVHLDHPKIRGLLARLPVFAKGEPIPSITFDGLPEGTTGCWSLWQLRVQSFGRTLVRIFPIFCGADGRGYTTTAGFIWERIPATQITVVGMMAAQFSDRLFEESYRRAQEDGRELYRQLEQEHQGLWGKEQEKGRFYYAARRRFLESSGLDEVRAFRSRQLETEERRWQETMARSKDVAPDLQAIAMANLKSR